VVVEEVYEQQKKHERNGGILELFGPLEGAEDEHLPVEQSGKKKQYYRIY